MDAILILAALAVIVLAAGYTVRCIVYARRQWPIDQRVDQVSR